MSSRESSSGLRVASLYSAADDKGRIGSSTWVEYDVTSLISGDGTYSLVLATASSDGIDFRSREVRQQGAAGRMVRG